MNSSEVLIVGAGPSGLVLALYLAKAGVKARIIDKNSGPGQQSRAMAVQARTLEFYRALGFADKIVDNGIKLDEIHIWLNGKLTGDAHVKDFGEGLSPFPFLLSYPQDEHEKLLVDQLAEAGVEVEWNTDLVSFNQNGNQVELKLINTENSNEEDLTVTYLCGCDGARSAVREGLHLEFSGGTYDHTYFVADTEADGSAAGNDSLNFCIQNQDFMLVLPIRTTGSFRLIGIIPQNLGTKTDITFDDLLPFVKCASDINITKLNWFSTYKVHHRVSEHFRVGNIFLSGDAGHIHSPVGGQGMNTGIGDAFNLGWKIAAVLQGRANPDILNTYEPERISFAHALLSTTDKIFQLMTGDNFTSAIFRDGVFPHLVPFLLGFGPIKSEAFKTISQIRVSYHDSELSEGKAGSLQAGDRLPWVSVDQYHDNFEPLQSLDWQIHVYGVIDDQLREAARNANISLFDFDWTNSAQVAGLAENAMYLIRPDGYIGLADTNQDVSKLKAYLDKFKIVSSGIDIAMPNNPPRSSGPGNILPQEEPIENPNPSFPSPFPTDDRGLINGPVLDDAPGAMNPVTT